MNGNEAKKVKLTDDLLEQVSGGTVTNKYKVVCPACGCLGTGLTKNAAMQMVNDHNTWHLKEWSHSTGESLPDPGEIIRCRYQLDFD